MLVSVDARQIGMPRQVVENMQPLDAAHANSFTGGHLAEPQATTGRHHPAAGCCRALGQRTEKTRGLEPRDLQLPNHSGLVSLDLDEALEPPDREVNFPLDDRIPPAAQADLVAADGQAHVIAVANPGKRPRMEALKSTFVVPRPCQVPSIASGSRSTRA